MSIYLVFYDRQSVERSETLYNAVEHYIDHYYENTDKAYRKRRLFKEKIILQESVAQSDCISIEESPIKRSLENLLHNMDETFSEMLLRLIDERGRTDVGKYESKVRCHYPVLYRK